MAAEVQELRVPGEKAITISKWKVRQGSYISKGVLMALYQTDDQDKDAGVQKLKAPNAGVVKKIMVKEGQLCDPGSLFEVPDTQDGYRQMTVLLEIGPQASNVCSHPTVMKDMCADCGADLRCELGLAGDRKEPVQASVAMVHCIPELIVSEEVALELGKADENRLLSSRKLALLVDLDQTLIHTTNDTIPNKLKDVYHFQLWHGRRLLWYHTKFRPGTKEFLEKISKLFELHICTFGVRMYAHTIARFIDPDGKYFSHRILSRDECFDAMSKTANLKALFPCGDCMVCIIDDREDVWNYTPNLVHVKPYHFFQGTADINAPPGLTKTENDSVPVSHEVRRASCDSQNSTEATNEEKMDGATAKDKTETITQQIKDSKKISSTSERAEENLPLSTSAQSDENSNKTAADNKNSLQSQEENSSDSEKSEKSSDSKGDNSKTSSADTTNKANLQPQLSEEEEIEWVDDDDYLIYLTDILTRIHTAYYDLYDQMKDKEDVSELPNVKNIIQYVKRKVLKGVNIVFSGVVPLNMAPEKCKAFTIAKSLGANVQTNIIIRNENPKENTTHLVTSKAGTAKYKFASKLKSINVVSVEWLMCCSYRWERVDERLFPVSEDTTAPSCDSPVMSIERRRDRKRKVQEPDSVFLNENSQESNSSKRSKNGDSEDQKDEEEGDSSQSRFATSFNPLYSFSDEDIECMDKEVEDLMEEDEDDDSDEDEEDREQRVRKQVLKKLQEDSSSDESLAGNFPRGWKKQSKTDEKVVVKKKKKNIDDDDSDDLVPDEDSENELDKYQKTVEAFSPESNGSESDKESIGSVDDEIADAVEKEFLSLL